MLYNDEAKWNIPEPGFNRDKMIAKLMGEELIIIDGYYYFKNRDGYTVPPYQYTPNLPLSKWSTERGFAWELWEQLELPKNYGQGMIDGYYQPSIHAVSIILHPYDSYNTQITGKDFADVVSKAWIIWKLEKQKNGNSVQS